MAKEQIGISGEFWFFSQLQRLGYEAYITLGNTKSVDISVKLNDDTIITFDVKSKENFIGSFQYLNNIPQKKNHFVAFTNLAVSKDSSGKTLLLAEPTCYIINALEINEIAFHWTSSKQTSSGYGFEAKLLWYLKYKNTTSITENNISNFKKKHNISNEIDFEKYNKIILTLEDFENQFYLKK